MKVLEAKKVSYTEKIEGQEYFQVLFEGDGEEYVLLQRVFEEPSDGRVYFECWELEDSGHYVIKGARLWRDRMRVKLPGLGGVNWEVRFEIGASRYNEMADEMRVIFSKPNQIEIETKG